MCFSIITRPTHLDLVLSFNNLSHITCCLTDVVSTHDVVTINSPRQIM